jgi:protein-disulfide isomerase
MTDVPPPPPAPEFKAPSETTPAPAAPPSPEGSSQPEQNPFTATQPAKSSSGRGLIIALLGVLVVVLAVLTAVTVVPMVSGEQASAGPAAAADYEVTVQDNVISVQLMGSEPTATVDVYFDYMCPYCGKFERANQLDLDVLVDAGKIRLRLNVLSFLDTASNGTNYSTRAGSAALTIATEAPEAFPAFHEALFANQPEEGTDGLSDDDLALLAERAGASAEAIALLSKHSYGNDLLADTTSVLKQGQVTGTPAVMINGTPSELAGDLYVKGKLKQAIEAVI